MDLDGNHVVIAGGSAGIGAGLADEFAERGAGVLVAARSESKLRAIAGPFAAAGLTRFRRLGFLPKLSVDKLVDVTVDAIESDRRFVRLPKRYGAYHALNNAPRRLVEAALLGVKFPPEWETAGEADEADESAEER